MASKWINAMKGKWRKVSGAAAVLLMFFVPITKAVLANAGARHSDNNRGWNKDNHSDRSCASDRTPPSASSVSRVKPHSSESRSYDSRSGKKGEGGRYAYQRVKPKGK